MIQLIIALIMAIYPHYNTHGNGAGVGTMDTSGETGHIPPKPPPPPPAP